MEVRGGAQRVVLGKKKIEVPSRSRIHVRRAAETLSDSSCIILEKPQYIARTHRTHTVYMIYEVVPRTETAVNKYDAPSQRFC